MTFSTKPIRVLCIVGARPNFMKIAPIMRAFEAERAVQGILLHTGQHYDEAMKGAFFEQLRIPEPDVDLGVGSASHALQTAEIMRRFEPELDRLRPGAVLVVGDVNSTIACALVAVKKGMPVIHVEAGLRSWDRTMPEEINRVLTDQISDLLFTTERDAAHNLEREGIDPARIKFVGNVMIDTLLYNRPWATRPADLLAALPDGERLVDEIGYGLLTLHRPSNVDDPDVLRGLLDVLCELSQELPLVFPVHPRTRARIEAAGLGPSLERSLLTMPPLGYLDMLGLMDGARLVLTDSGGIQEETTALGVPCITLRENTERPTTVTEGTNTVVGTDPDRIRVAFHEALDGRGKAGRVPERWDGHAAERIATAIGAWAQGSERRS